VRCFIACFLKPTSAERLVAVLPALAGVRRVPASNLHVTLKFLGNVANGQRQAVLDLADRLEGKETRARLLELTGFPKTERARAVVARLAVDPVLMAWNEQLSDSWQTEEWNRKFDPHVTLARSRRGVQLSKLEPLPGIEIELCPPAAYLSRTLPGGALYEPLAG